MSIARLDRITLYGAARQKDDTIRRLQDLGCVHLMNLGGEEVELESDVAEEDRAALEYLDACGQKLQPVRRAQDFDRQEVVAETIEVQRAERELIDERAELRKAIADLEPWGEFRLPTADRLGGLRWSFHVVPLHQLEDLAQTDLPYHEAARDHRNAYVVVLGPQQREEMPGRPVRLDERPLSVLRDRVVEVEEQLEDLRHRRIGLTRWRALLAHALDRADDATARLHASHMTFDDRGIFALTGWAPHALAERALVGLALLVSAVYQGQLLASSINASKSKPSVFGISVAPAGIVEGFAVFAFVFGLVLAGSLPASNAEGDESGERARVEIRSDLPGSASVPQRYERATRPATAFEAAIPLGEMALRLAEPDECTATRTASRNHRIRILQGASA